jgi:hypothetical protein
VKFCLNASFFRALIIVSASIRPIRARTALRALQHHWSAAHACTVMRRAFLDQQLAAATAAIQQTLAAANATRQRTLEFRTHRVAQTVARIQAHARAAINATELLAQVSRCRIANQKQQLSH